ncbi:MAG: hypothetical protein IKB50_03160 [Clostridia bacterium]|nr:hypothetical protein [Clostridia bacterium]
MKKKIVYISVVVVIILLVSIFGRGIYFYGKYSVPNAKYFGSQYKEMLHIMSFQDKKQANEVMKTVGDAFSFIGDADDAESIYGKLSRYCIISEEAATETHNLKMITADFDKDNGYIWFVYNHEAFDNNGLMILGSRDVLVRATLNKTGQGWMIIETKEHS